MGNLDRLMNVARVWSGIKFFHPQLACHTKLDWDAALISCLSILRVAGSTSEYASALQQMLDTLADPATRVREFETRERVSTEPRPPFRRKTDSGVLIVAFGAFDNTDWAAAIPETTKLLPDLPGTPGIVFDLRNSTITEMCFGWTGLGRRLSTTPLVKPGRRSRMHAGFASQQGSGSGSYYSGFQVTDGEVVTPHKEASDVPCVFVADADCEVPGIALALQRAGKAAIVVAGGGAIAPMVETADIDIGEGLEVCIRAREPIYVDGTTTFMPDAVVHRPEDILESAIAMLGRCSEAAPPGAPAPFVGRMPAEPGYPEMSHPPLEYRLLAAFRIWSVFHYFFPYKDLIGEDWNDVLREFIPQFEAADDALSYAQAVARMVARTSDSHCFVRSPVLDSYYGMAPPAARVRMIEGQPVVVSIGAEDEVGGLAVGDVVVSVDGIDVETRIAALGQHRAASTPQSYGWLVAQRLLCGADGSTATIAVKRGETAAVCRALRASGNWERFRDQRTGDIVKHLSVDIGYVDLDRLPASETDAMFERLKATKAIIFDMRGYPYGTAWTVAPRLAARGNTVGAVFEKPLVGPEQIESGDTPNCFSIQSFAQKIPRSEKWRYTGRTIILVDERTVSQAEHTALFFKEANGTTIVGSPTTGANGDVTQFVLPGGIWIWFTGQAVKHADGSQLQRVGIIPDVLVYPTIAGIKAGRDEVLEKAVALLDG